MTCRLQLFTAMYRKPTRLLVSLLLLSLPWCAWGSGGAQPSAGSQPQAGSNNQSSAPALKTRTRYTLRPGDSVTTDYRLTPEFNQTVVVQPDGYMDLAIAGSLHAAGLDLDQLHDLVVSRVSERLKSPELNISLKEFERPYLVVAGEVPHPGRFDFYEKTTALQAVLLAGGFSASAQQSDVYVFRKVSGDLAEVHHLNLKKMHSRRDLERDLVLQPGDMILVPRNRLENFSRFMKASNLSLFFDPLQYAIR